MSHSSNNVRPFVYRQVRPSRAHQGLAEVIPLHPRGRRPPRRHPAVFPLVAIAAMIATLAALLMLLSSDGAVIGRLVPGWPWW
jgi:hypothetical protein